MQQDLTKGFTPYITGSSRLLDEPRVAKRTGILLVHYTVIDKWVLFTTGNLRKRYHELAARMRYNKTGNRLIDALPQEHMPHKPYVLQTRTLEEATEIVRVLLEREVGGDRMLNVTQVEGLRGQGRTSFSEEKRKEMSDAMRARWADPEFRARRTKAKSHCVPVYVDGVEYPSMLGAGKALGVSGAYVHRRCHDTSDKWPTWSLVPPALISLATAA